MTSAVEPAPSRFAARPTADARPADEPHAALALAVAGLSGCAGLGCEIVWTQQLGIALGHEYAAVLAVLAAFFGGLALGAHALGRRVARTTRPGLGYAACEAVIAAWTLALSAGLPPAAGWLAARLGPEPGALWHWSLAFLGPLLLLLPACAAMGATLPALERALGHGDGDGFALGGLYAANTAGAVLGALGCALLLVPGLGLTRTAQLCAGLDALCAALALAAWGHARRAPAAARAPRAGDRGLLWRLAAAGALGIGYEVGGVRALAQLAQDTVYSFAILLAVYLLGSAAGAALYQRRLAARAGRAGQREALLLAAAGACLLGACALQAEAALGFGRLRDPLAALGGVSSALLGVTGAALAAFLLPALAMGALFSQLCVEARLAGLAWGPALAANTAGAALAPPLFGVWLRPALGAKAALLAVALGYALLLRPRALRGAPLRGAAAALATGALAWAALAPPLAVVDVPAGGRLVSFREGVAAAVSVVEDAAGTAVLRIDNQPQEGSSATLLADARQAWLPLLLHAQPRRALFLGLGTGVTAGSAAWDPELRVDAVELLPEVALAAPRFAAALASERAPRIVVADARRYVRAAGPLYDVIVADLFHPARGGSAALFSAEHFAAVSARLAPGGLFCQWLPLHQLDIESLRSIVSAFLRSFPDARALLATNSLETPVLGLLAQPGSAGLDAAALRERLRAARGPGRLGELELEDEFAVLGSFVAGPRALVRFAAGAVPSSDDRPIVAYRAPFLAYERDADPRPRLLQLLALLRPEPAELLTPAARADAATVARLAAYWDARRRFLELGARVPAGLGGRALIERLQGPLLELVRLSPEFRPAYDPLLRMAQVLAEGEPGAARSLLAELAALQPARDDAARLLRRLGAGAPLTRKDPA